MAPKFARITLAFVMLVGLTFLTTSPGFAQGQKKDDLGAVAKKLKAAVAAGKLTEAQAMAKWNAILEKAWLKKVAKKLKAAVAAGKLTESEARAKWNAILKKVAAKKKKTKK